MSAANRGHWGEMKVFSLRSKKRQGCPPLLLLFNVIMKILVRVIRQEKEIKSSKSTRKM